MKRLLIASHNKGKIAEIEPLLAPLGIKVFSAADFSLPEPEETGVTFAENAELKARLASEAAGITTLGDDSGLCIPALDDMPGIYSARWTGPQKNYAHAFECIQSELINRNVKDPNPPAYFFCALALCKPGEDTQHFQGVVDGKLSFPPRGSNGFGYDPIFIPKGETRTLGEMTFDEKQAISHRARAIAMFISAVRSNPDMI